MQRENDVKNRDIKWINLNQMITILERHFKTERLLEIYRMPYRIKLNHDQIRKERYSHFFLKVY